MITAATCVYGGTVTLNFDDVPSDTIINTYYPGLTFSNTKGGDVWARQNYFPMSAPNDITITPPPYWSLGFDERSGTIQVDFATPTSFVSIDTYPITAPEGFNFPRRPYMQVYDTSGTLLTTRYYSKTLPGAGGSGETETLSYTAASALIGRVRLSCEAPNGYGATYAYFDNLSYSASGSYSLYSLSKGGGSVSVSPSQPSYPSGTVVTLTATPVAGWLFTGWTGDITSSMNPLTVTMTANMNITANFIPHGVNTINFDNVAQGTAINNFYPGLVFTNALGGSAYARYSMYAPSATNVVSIFATGLPEFDAYYGAVDVYLSVPVRSVSIDARPELPVEGLPPYTKKPYLQAFDTAGNYIANSTVYYSQPLPTTAGAIGPAETLTYTSSSANIGRVRFSSQNPAGATATYGLFDNFSYDAGVYIINPYISGGGSLTMTPSQQTYTYGSAASIKATPAVGWLFSGWSGAASGNANPLSLSMTADQNITATFTSTVPSIIIDDNSATFHQPLFAHVWTNVTDLLAYNDHYRVTAAEQDSSIYAIYRPDIPVTGFYDLSILYPNTSGLGTDYAGVYVYHNGVGTYYTVDESSYGGRWRLIDQKVKFAKGTDNYIKLYSKQTQAGHYLVADAFRLAWSTTQVEPPLTASKCQPGSGKMTISWDAIPGRVYQLQYKNSLSDASWTTISGTITATDWTASKDDTSTAGRPTRYYRIMMLPQ